MHPDMIVAFLATLAGEGLLAVDPERVARAAAPRDERRAGAVVVIPVTGIIVPRTVSTWFGALPGQDGLRARVAAAARNPDIGAIVLDVDSPGGIVNGTAETAAAVREAAAQKPVVAVANGLMASAAYWLASGATEIVLAPNAEVGSIGILAAHQSYAKLHERLGVETTVVSAGRYKAEATPFAPLSDEAKAALQARADAAYETFAADVAAGRRASVSKVKTGYGEGRVLEGARALAAGLADRIATLDQVVAELLAGRGAAKSFRRRSALAFA
ncbi:MAG TPA: S49 family peptidase [Beijerinckiaceae bacterium]|nr:S49 family peptidase [Beijerinckiaceae bacterium]